MESKNARLKIIQNWINEGKNESRTFNSEETGADVRSQYQYVEKNTPLKELGEQFLNILRSYQSPDFEGPDWKVEISIQDRKNALYVISNSNELAVEVHPESPFNEEELDARLSMTYEEFRALTNLETDLISIMIRNRGAEKDKSAKPMTLIRPLSDLLFGAFNLYHLNPVFKNTLIEKLYKTGKVSNLSGSERFVFPWAISADIGNMLYELITEKEVKNSLEIGLAFGLSALFICQAHKNKNYGYHTAIDPCQSLEFESIGTDQIRKAGLDDYFRLLEEKDYDILPILAREKEKFDFIFIDGLHMHDYVVLDYFYGDLLLEVDGLLAFDDCHTPGVSSAVAYLENNRDYKCLEQYSGDRLRVYQKLTEDNRTLNNPSHHVEYFQKAYEIWGVENKLPAEQPNTSLEKSVAIIGIDGVLPKGKTIREFWQSIADEELLYDRYPPDYLYTRVRKNGNGEYIVGGMVDSAFEFDPQFFHISNSEAEMMDPQLRHLLMSVHRAIEDAGYTAKELSESRVGVFIGAEGSDYNDLHRMQALEDGYFLNHSGSSLANRLSYHFDFKGPSEVINTMCSSGAFCIYRAVELLRKREIDFAIIGAVKLNFSAATFQSLSNLNITSKKDKCYSFHRNSEGYIRSEGVITMVLTSEEKAIEGKDFVYAKVKEASVNFNGKDGHSMFSPSKNGQKEAIKQCYKKADVSVADIAYIEAQGMGNEVSDFVEFNAINEACEELLNEGNTKGYPAISTIKPILGHMECVSALGALLKIVLSFRTRTVYRIPYLQQPDINPRLGPEDKRCHLLTANTVIQDDRPMLAGLNSFGASGTNVHLLLEESVSRENANERTPQEQILIISARSEASLFQYVNGLNRFLNKPAYDVSLLDLCYTFQMRREHHPHRVIFYIEKDSEENQIQKLKEMFTVYLRQENQSGAIRDNLQDSIHHYKKLSSEEKDLVGNVALFNDGLSWLAGEDIDWTKHHRINGYQKVGGMPTYPFDLRPYKLDIPNENNGPGSQRESQLHPLLHINTSDINQLRFSTTFSGEEFFLTDHQVHGKKILPGVAYLEMARAAIEKGVSVHPESCSLELRNVVWVQPIVVTENQHVDIALFANDNRSEEIEFEIYSRNDEQEIVHCQGQVVFSNNSESTGLDVEELKRQMQDDELSAESIYQAFAAMGINYGPSHQGITSIYRGENQLLATVKLPAAVEGEKNGYLLHPSLMDSALQATMGLIGNLTEPALPFALDSLRIVSACTREMFAWVRYSAGSQPDDRLIKLDIDLCDQDGKICVQLRGLSSRVLKGELDAPDKKMPFRRHREETGAELQVFVPVWNPVPSDTSSKAEVSESDAILQIGGTQAQLDWVRESYPNTRFLQLPSDSTIETIQAKLKECSFDHLLWIAPDEGPDPIIDQQEQEAIAIFRIIKALLNLDNANKELQWTIITKNTQKVKKDDWIQPTQAGIIGLISKASPHWNIRLLDVDSLESVSADECLSHSQRTVLAYRQGEWFSQSLANLEFPPETDPAYKQGGVYVVIGDVEGLAEVWSRFMIEQYQAKIVWISGQDEAEIEDKRNALSQVGDAPLHFSIDATQCDALEKACEKILKTHPGMDGVVYAPRIPQEQDIAQMEESEFRAALSAEVEVSINMNKVFGERDLDFMLFFTPVIPITDAAGQCDYIAGYSFTDSLAQSLQEKYPYPVKIMNWGGIKPYDALSSLQTLVSSELNQVVLIEAPDTQAASHPDVSATDSLREKSISYFQKLVAQTLKMNPQQIEPNQPFENYGLDSILVVQLTDKLREVFPDISTTLFFEVQSIEGLVEYFLDTRKDDLLAVTSNSTASAAIQPSSSIVSHFTEQEPISSQRPRTSRRRPFQDTSVTVGKRSVFDVAIVGLSGRYPQSKNIHEFWANLSNGVDCITEIPRERWNWEEYYDAERGTPGKIYTKWGGFMEDIDKFDPLFFKISPKEAKRIDPQERLFLEASYHAIEDAGYTPETLGDPEKIGIFVGVMNSRYTPQPNYFSIANRVSYIFNFQGPSMAVDTACSSSLTAVHLALESIYSGLSECAIAGGVNVIIDPVHYLVLSELNMLTSGNQSRAFGDNADGIVDAEGVGAIVLKPLKQAEQDRDHIYGVIKGSSINAGGKTNGYTVPNPKAQSNLVSDALQRANITADQLSYVEAHGTGTALGDPIEIAGLTRAFKETTHERQFCAIGSVKSNIGHCESAAGIAGLTKVLLQLKHQQLVPSLHSQVPNPEIDFSQTPFKVQKTLEQWPRPSRKVNGAMQALPRIAGISSFGAGGANAHVIVGEYQPPTEAQLPVSAITQNTPAIILLSARTDAQLNQKARDLLDFVRKEEQPIDLHALAYTLQVGREAMEERLGFIVKSIDQLIEKLQAFIDGEQDIEDMYRGQIKRTIDGIRIISQDDDMKEAIDKWLTRKKFSKLLDLWVKGLEVDWNKLHADHKPYRMSLPTYPFAKERYWIEPVDDKQHATTDVISPGMTPPALHPLVHTNTSDFGQQSYRSTFTGSEFFLKNYQVERNGGPGQKILPAVAYLEMACAAIKQASSAQEESHILELHNTVWGEPAIITENKDISIALLPTDNEHVDFEIYSQDKDQEIIHCQGHACLSRQFTPAKLDLGQLKGQLGQNMVREQQGSGTIYKGESQLLAELRLPNENHGNYILHPSLLDSALQAAVNLIENSTQLAPLPPPPFSLESLQILSACTDEMLAWVRYSQNHYADGSHSEDNLIKLDMDLCDKQGRVCVQMRGITYQPASIEMLSHQTDSPVTSEATMPPITPKQIAITPPTRKSPVLEKDSFSDRPTQAELDKPTNISLVNPSALALEKTEKPS